MGGSITEVGIDWLTATAQPGQKAASLFLWGAGLLRTREREHNKPLRQVWQRYSGELCGGVFLGQRADGTVLRLSGDQADRWWKSTVEKCDNISRLDTQVTWTDDTYDTERGYEALNSAIYQRRNGGHPFKITHTAEYEGGFTLYLGSRASDRFGRLYDKWQESQEECYRNSWRYEIELKSDQALACAKQLATHAQPAQHVTSTVYNFFRERGVRPPWSPGDGQYFRRVHIPPPDDEKRLNWLGQTIVPVIEGLQTRGLGEQVQQLLGGVLRPSTALPDASGTGVQE
jgi:replication initiation factor